MIRTVIIGAAGRMGRMLIANVAKNANFEFHNVLIEDKNVGILIIYKAENQL